MKGFDEEIDKLLKVKLTKEKDDDYVIGSLAPKRAILNMLLFSIMHKKEMRQKNITHPQGVLLYGVPGVGKSMLAKYCGLKYQSKYPISIKIWEPKDYMAGRVGKSSNFISNEFAAMREKIKQGNQFIIIINEIELLVPKSSGRSLEKERAIAMLNEITGMSDDVLRGNLFLIGTTNNPGSINSAFLRSLRIKPVRVDLPTYEDRLEWAERFRDIGILDIINKEDIAELTKGFTGADFEALKYELFVLTKERDEEGKKINADDVTSLLGVHSPFATNRALIEIAKFEQMYKNMQKGFSDGNKIEVKDMNFDLPFK